MVDWRRADRVHEHARRRLRDLRYGSVRQARIESHTTAAVGRGRPGLEDYGIAGSPPQSPARRGRRTRARPLPLPSSRPTGVTTKIYTDRADRACGTNGRDILIGRGGNDWLSGKLGSDSLRGGPKNPNNPLDKDNDNFCARDGVTTRTASVLLKVRAASSSRISAGRVEAEPDLILTVADTAGHQRARPRAGGGNQFGGEARWSRRRSRRCRCRPWGSPEGGPGPAHRVLVGAIAAEDETGVEIDQPGPTQAPPSGTTSRREPGKLGAPAEPHYLAVRMPIAALVINAERLPGAPMVATWHRSSGRHARFLG